MNPLILFADSQPAAVIADNHANWYTPVSDVVRTLLWICFIVWALKKFGDEIKKLLARIASLKFPGGGADFNRADIIADQLQSKPPSMSAEIDKAYEKEKSVPLTAVQKEIYDKIMADVKKSPYTKDQVIDVGVMGMARVVSEADFWRIYALIFGSQLALLQQANSGPLKEADIVNHWTMLQQRFPAVQNMQREVYLKFLFENLLLLRDENQLYHLTVKGREFLIWVTSHGLSNKGFQ